MGWLDDAAGWIDERKKDVEGLSSAVAAAPEAAVKKVQEAIIGSQKASEAWSRELEDVVLKAGTMPYEMLPQPIKDQLEKLKKTGAALTETTQSIIADIRIPEIPEIIEPLDLFGAVNQILRIIRVPGHLFLNWMKITEQIFTGNSTLFKELERYGKRTGR